MATCISLFPPIRRVRHNEDATAIVSKNSPISTPLRKTSFGFTRLWATDEHPADMVSPQDKALQDPGLAPKGFSFDI